MSVAQPGTRAAPDEEDAYRHRLVEAGLLLPLGTPGLAGRGAALEAIIEGLETVVQRAGADMEATTVRFPPVVPRRVVERAGYLRSFPNMVGSVSSFAGGDAEHRRLLADVEAGVPWHGHMHAVDAMLCSAACHPLYPTITGPVPVTGRRWDVYGWVFRNEPSEDPARLQCFRQYEYVVVGGEEAALAHRDLWRGRALDILGGLGLGVEAVVANDPFFGRLGGLMAGAQAEAELKWEIVAPTGPGRPATAITSANCHREHFGEAFGIHTDDGEPAHSACVGFGVERIALALLWEHGLRPEGWPGEVRRELGL